MSDRSVRLLSALADRAVSDPAYLASLLRRYQASEGIGRSAVAALLGIREESLTNLSLCLRPRAELFAADVLAIAADVNADADALAAIIRRVDAVDAMTAGGAATTNRGFLLAARAREVAAEEGRSAGAESGAAHEFLSEDRGQETGSRDDKAGE